MHGCITVTYFRLLVHQNVEKAFLLILLFLALVKSLIYGHKCLIIIFFFFCFELY